MCGLVGIAQFNKNSIGREKDIFQQMLVCGQVRGTHGTGVFKIHKKGDMEYRKIYGSPFDLFRSEGFYKTFWEPIPGQWIRWLVGHNRYATTGAKTTENAHPFSHEHITLVHNGTIDKWLSDIPELRHESVDSKAIAISIVERGLEKTLEGLSGAWALAYFDQNTKMMNFLRNKERDLFFAFSEKDKVVAFATELPMLEWIMWRNDVKDVEYKELPVDELWQFSLDDMNPVKTNMEEHRKRFLPISWDEGKERKIAEDEVSGVWTSENGVWTETPRGSLQGGERKEPEETRTEVNPSAPQWAKDDAANRQAALPAPKRDFGKFYAPYQSLFDLKPKSLVLVDITDFEEVGKKVNTFLVKGESKAYPDIEFRVLVKGRKKLDHVMFGDKLQGCVSTLLRSNRPTHPNLVYFTHESALPAWIDEKTGEVFTCEFVEEELRTAS